MKIGWRGRAIKVLALTFIFIKKGRKKLQQRGKNMVTTTGKQAKISLGTWHQ